MQIKKLREQSGTWESDDVRGAVQNVLKKFFILLLMTTRGQYYVAKRDVPCKALCYETQIPNA